ncbi:hypothetical protein N7466_005400 [Penicillium verhagenii]|uniref:uncharacterized protein n=1 Tax=Penicillium verhagenii TaxID=1562060 RepID=UPI002544F587|nr:uncharacterized protein N7466_005400 [Penicillium verhagenii]KAJ5935853.1 hypothetical protein N7466_005400 [Penicillium verhagenii]
MPVNVITTAGEFQEFILHSSDLVVLDCYAEWCGPCKAIAPLIEKWSDEYENIKFYKLDVEKANDLAVELNVTAMPTFMFFNKGEKVTEIVGVDQRQIVGAIMALAA